MSGVPGQGLPPGTEIDRVCLCLRLGGRRKAALDFLKPSGLVAATCFQRCRLMSKAKNTWTQGTSVSPIYAGLTVTCPRCGKGSLLQTFLNLREHCSVCGLNYKFVDTGDGPAVFAIFILGFLVLGGALWVDFNFEPPLWVHVVLWGVVTAILALGLLRFLKATLIALQYYHRAEEGRLSDD